MPMAAMAVMIRPKSVAVSTFPTVPDVSSPTSDSSAGPRGRMSLTDPSTNPTSIDHPTRYPTYGLMARATHTYGPPQF